MPLAVLKVLREYSNWEGIEWVRHALAKSSVSTIAMLKSTHCEMILCRPMVSTLVGILLSNAGVIPCNSPTVYGLVNKYMLPLAIPLLLLTADLRYA